MDTKRTKSSLTWLTSFAILLGLAIGFLVNWLTWKLWMWIIPQWFPSAPQNVKEPSFLLFWVTMMVLYWIVLPFFRLMFSGIKNK